MVASLKSCPGDIEAACVSTTDIPQSCSDIVGAFDADFKECAKKTTSEEHCSCLSPLDYSKVSSCKKTINDAFKSTNNERKECVSSVGICKTNSLEVVGIVDNCKLLTDTAVTAVPESTAAPSGKSEVSVDRCRGWD